MQYSFTTIHDIKIAQPILDKQLLQESENPYWAKIWHSAVALVQFIEANTLLFHQKRIIELGAGLGLPSLYVSQYAASVRCTDIALEAIDCVKAAIKENNFTNITAELLDSTKFENFTDYDIVLISDLNYEPTIFEALQKQVVKMLDAELTVYLTTPQRLMAKPFIIKLLPFVKASEEYSFTTNDQQYFISLFHLKK